MSRRLVSRRQKKGFSGDGSKKQERQRREKLEAASLRDQPVAFEKILNDTPEEVSVWWQLPGGRQPAGGKFHQSLTPDKLSMQKKCVPSSTHEVCVNFRDPSLSRAITTCLQVHCPFLEEELVVYRVSDIRARGQRVSQASSGPSKFPDLSVRAGIGYVPDLVLLAGIRHCSALDLPDDWIRYLISGLFAFVSSLVPVVGLWKCRRCHNPISSAQESLMHS
eukprot:gnl/TRDRNA2_/TRDRNA2_133877_c1_seq1.p1 gnl/TRDRNA2_/TRDRNA2_133877_c1~~gnl/TRDRNA2_/TRDRNA2_133877_c1_seq1.p1  ORF type:complete len:221 (+),score=22.46 gnl/TRDRNA2_/TRDRNA2_133877_c1_seq1:24-686(+)